MQIVSVVIPFYNQGDFIEECIESVYKQTYKFIEIIVIDDGSTDEKSINILKKVKLKYPDIKIMSIKNSGVAIARNVGINNSEGEYILPLDADDKIASKYIEKCVKILNNNKEVDVVYCICKCFGHKNGILVLDDFSEVNMLRKNHVFCTALYRKIDFDKTIGYNPNMIYGYEDWDFWLSMIELGKKFYRINEILFYYRIKQISRNTEINKFENKMIQQVFNNHRKLYYKYNVDIEYINEQNSKNINYKDRVLKKIKYLIQKIKLVYLSVISAVFK